MNKKTLIILPALIMAMGLVSCTPDDKPVLSPEGAIAHVATLPTIIIDSKGAPKSAGQTFYAVKGISFFALDTYVYEEEFDVAIAWTADNENVTIKKATKMNGIEVSDRTQLTFKIPSGGAEYTTIVSGAISCQEAPVKTVQFTVNVTLSL